MNVLVHREEIYEIDDGSLPSARAIHVPDGTTLVDFLKLARRYLPEIPGGRATWVCEGEVPLAILTQEYREPWPLTGGNRSIVHLAGKLPNPHFFFRYRPQESPEDAYRRLGGDPVHLPKEAWDASQEISWSDGLRRLLAPGRNRFRAR